MAKRYTITKTDGQTGATNKVGSGAKTVAKAYALRQRMRAQQSAGSSNSFSLPNLETK